MTSIQLRSALDIGGFRTHLAKLSQQRSADIGMRHFSAAEPNRHLDSIAVLQELLRALDLDIEVVGVDTGRHPDFLDLSHMLILLGFFFLFGLFKAELTVVHDLAHRRGGIGRDLYQVQPLIISSCKRIPGGHDTKLFTCGVDHADFLVSDILIELMV